MANETNTDREKILADYEEQLDQLSDEELLGEEYVEELRQEAIQERLSAIEDELNEMSNEELLDEHVLWQAREDAIGCMVEEYEEQLDADLTT